MFRSGDYNSNDLLALMEEDRPWTEYDEYSETQIENSRGEGRLSVSILRDGKPLWSNTVFPYTANVFSLQVREQWCAACFRVEVAKAFLAMTDLVIEDCTDRAIRKALKKKRRSIEKEAAPYEKFKNRMYRLDARAERDQVKTQANAEANDWLHKHSS